MLPAAPLPWLTATQEPRAPAVQAGAAAEEARAVSPASTAPDEPAAKAAVVTISPVMASAITAATRRAVLGGVARYFMSGRPGMARDPLLAPGQAPRPVRQTGAMTRRAELTRRAQAHGVAVSYQNWRGRPLEVPDE